MMTTMSRSETAQRIERATAGLGPPDRYVVLDIPFSLTTDSTEVRDFFRAAYRRFRSGDDRRQGGAPLPLVAVMDPDRAGPFVSAGDTMRDLAGRAMPENRAFLFMLNSLMDRITEHMMIHGAAVSIGGKGLILAGPPTAGKSTLVIELARRPGVTFLSDDVAPLDRDRGLLHPFPRAIGIRRDGGRLPARFDPAGFRPGSVHALPHKWLVDPEVLGLTLPQDPAAVWPPAVVVLLETGQAAKGSAACRAMEIALAEDDGEAVRALERLEGVEKVRPMAGSEFPRYNFTARASAHPMAALTAFCHEWRDLVLYLDEARPSAPSRGERPHLVETSWPPVLMELARELMNRSPQGGLMASCGGLPGLVTELGGLLKGARAYRLRPGDPEPTADLLFALASGSADVGTRGTS